MQELILLAALVAALYYLYRRLIKNRGCGCGSKGCGSCSQTPLSKSKADDEPQS